MLGVAADLGLDPDLLRAKRRWAMHQEDKENRTHERLASGFTSYAFHPPPRHTRPQALRYSIVPNRVQSSAFPSDFLTFRKWLV